jgi:DNA replication and repair protein RecF
MLLESIEAENFRNLQGLVALGSGLNIFAGENGQGKTNWLEAIAVLASARSFRTARLQDAVNFDSESALVRGRVRESPEIVRELQVAIAGNTKALSINGKKETVNGYLGQLHAVVFNSDELEIVRGQPDARRRFLDAGIVSLHPPFVQVFADYARVIRQKNVLLQQARDDGRSIETTAESLEPWHEQLAPLAAKIHRGRIRFVERINEVLEKKLFGREETIRYQSTLSKGDPADYENLISETLASRPGRVGGGPRLGYPHRDDLESRFDGHDIRKFGSAGQQRSPTAFYRKYSRFRATQNIRLLIDDIDAELDHKRTPAAGFSGGRHRRSSPPRRKVLSIDSVLPGRFSESLAASLNPTKIKLFFAFSRLS